MAIKILDKFESTAANKVLADAAEIRDYTQGKSQEAINASVKSEIETLKANGSGERISFGHGLLFGTDGKVFVSIGSSLRFDGTLGSNEKIEVNIGKGLTLDADGKICSDDSTFSVSVGNGLKKTSSGAIRINISTIEQTGPDGYTGPDMDHGLKISTSDGTLGVNVGSGLKFGGVKVGRPVMVNAGSGLTFGGDNKDNIMVNAGDGLIFGTGDASSVLKVSIGKGLALGSSVAVGNIGIGVKVDNKYVVYTSDDKLTLNITELKKALGLTA